MKLMTEEFEEAFRKQGSTQDKKGEDILVLAHYFTGTPLEG